MTTTNEAGRVAGTNGGAVPMNLPECPNHGQMELQKPGTREQEYCGTFYSCPICHSGVLFTSAALESDLAAYRNKAVRP